MGNLLSFFTKGKALQQQLPKCFPSKQSEERLAQSFVNLMMFKGKTKAALQLLSNQGKGGVLHPDDTVPSNNSESLSVLEILKSKHSAAEPASANIEPSEG